MGLSGEGLCLLGTVGRKGDRDLDLDLLLCGEGEREREWEDERERERRCCGEWLLERLQK